MCSGMSIFNINCKSMHCNFTKPNDFLSNCIPKFYTVCLAETWPIALDFYSQDE